MITKLMHILVLVVLGISIPKKASADTYIPMISCSWDRMLGFNLGLGLSVGNSWFAGMSGPYVYANVSLDQPAISFSSGYYKTFLGLISMRNGVNIVRIWDGGQEGYYLGLENSMTVANGLVGFESRNNIPLMLIGGYYRLNPLVSLHKDPETRLRLNAALGFGVL